MIDQLMTDPVLAHITRGTYQIDQSLPSWARRSNPIVRRQLGIYWKTLPLELRQWLRVLAVEIVLVLIAAAFPLFYSFIMPVVTVSVLLVPFVFIIYGRALAQIAVAASNSMYDEVHNGTLPLLLVTPFPSRHILYSKVAASVWRQSDNLSLVIAGHVLLSLPMLILQYATLFSPDTHGLVTSVTIIASLLANLIRLLLEPVLVGAVGVLVGAVAGPRVVANIATMALCAAYFAFLNIPRLMDLTFEARVLVEIALPLVLPVLLSAGLFVATARLLRRG